MTQNLPAVVPLGDLEKMAVAFAKSGMFGAKTPEQAMALLLLAQGEGLHPAIAMRDFDVIQGRPAKKAEAMLRSFLGAGGKVEWHTLTDECADATFSHPQGGTARITWDMKRAKLAGVGNKDMYNKYPRQMLRSRVVSEGCRTIYPASTSGLYVPEEVVQFGPQREKDITPTAGYLAELPAKKQEVMHETATEIKALWANEQAADAYALIENSGFSDEEMIALWSLLPSNIRSAHKRIKEQERATEKGTISPAQHKRLEAVIKESGFERESIKKVCRERWGVEHFTDLTKDQYKDLDAAISDMVDARAKAAPVPPIDVISDGHGGAKPASPQLNAIIAAIEEVKGQKSKAAVEDMIKLLSDETERKFATEALDWHVADVKSRNQSKL